MKRVFGLIMALCMVYSSLSAFEPAPSFAENDIMTGEKIKLEDYRGKVMLVHFWATWNPPCKKMIPELNAVQAKYHGRFIVIGASVDRLSFDKVRQFSMAKGISYPVIMANALRNFWPTEGGLPTSFLVDRKGNIVKTILGVKTAAELSTEIEPFLEPVTKKESVPSLVSAEPKVEDREVRSSEKIELDNYKGKVVLVNFFASWNSPSIHQIPDLIRLKNLYKNRLEIIGAAMDAGANAPERIKNFAKNGNVTYPIVMGAELRKLWPEAKEIPVTFILDTNGNIVGKLEGRQDFSGLRRSVAPYLPGMIVRSINNKESIVFAARYGQITKLQEYIELGGDVNITDSKGATLLHNAVENGHIDSVKLLLDSKANVNRIASKGTPLHWASTKGNLEIVRALLEKGASPNSHDENGNTPLHNAAYWGHMEVVKELLKNGCIISQKNKYGYTAAKLAQTKFRKNIVSILAAQNAQ